MRRPIGLVSTAAAIAVIVGCALPGGTLVERTPAPIAVVGALGADDLDCLWIRDDAGRKTFLMVPSRITVRVNPLELFAADGSLIAREGDEVVADGIRPDGGETICGPGVPVPVDTIRRIGSPTASARS
jgi:hypothetical protein